VIDQMPDAAPEEVGLASAGLDRVDDAVREQVRRGVIAGAVTLVARHGRVVRRTVMGVDRVLPRRTLREDTIFHIFSMTKPITGVAMGILADRGMWAPDDPIAQHLPELADLRVLAGMSIGGTPILEDAGHQPTMRELMTHTAGFGYGIRVGRPVDATEALYRRHDPLYAPTLRELVARLARLPLAHQPGSRWRYSISMDIQGAIIERLTGRTLWEFLRDEIFAPLGMRDTAFHVPREKHHRLAQLHWPTPLSGVTPVRNPLFRDHRTPPTAPLGGGGLYGTADDYARFAQLLLNRGTWDGTRIVSEEALAAQMTNQLPETMLDPGFGAGAMRFRPGFGYGYNGAVVYDPEAAALPVGRGSYFWDGAAGTWFWVDPENDLLYVGMIQQFFTKGSPLLQEVTQTLMADAITTS
jgi:CubicO group peptidase (beta-lactamase class C family)